MVTIKQRPLAFNIFDQNAKSTIDDGTLGGVSGNGINLQTGNIQTIFAAMRARLGRYNVTQNRGGKIGSKGLFLAGSPDFIQVLVNYLAGKNSNLGECSEFSVIIKPCRT